MGHPLFFPSFFLFSPLRSCIEWKYDFCKEALWGVSFSSTWPWRSQEMAQPTTPVKPGDEVAFFPPVTGG